MFWGKETKSVNFAVSDISCYARNISDARAVADDCYQGVSSWADKIVDALGEIIDVGTHNLEVCMYQIEVCEEYKNVTEKKINALVELTQQIEKSIYYLDESISKANDAYKKACEAETRAKNSTASNEQEAKIRKENIAAAHQTVRECKEHLSKLREKRSKLFNAKTEIGVDISELNHVCSELYYINSQLNQERQRISYAVENAKSLLDKVRNSLERLRRSFKDDINGTLFECEKAANTALNRARVANNKMGELNGKSYSDYDTICVTDINALKNMSDRMSEEISNMVKHFGDIYKICNEHGEALGDNIMANALAVLESVSETERLALKQLTDKSIKLKEFSRSLESYYSSKM